MIAAILKDSAVQGCLVGLVVALGALPRLIKGWKSAPAGIPPKPVVVGGGDSAADVPIEPVSVVAEPGSAAPVVATLSSEPSPAQPSKPKSEAPAAKTVPSSKKDTLDSISGQKPSGEAPLPQKFNTGATITGGLSPAITYLHSLKLQIEHFETEIHQLRAQVVGFAQKHDSQFENLLKRMGEMQVDLHQQVHEHHAQPAAAKPPVKAPAAAGIKPPIKLAPAGAAPAPAKKPAPSPQPVKAPAPAPKPAAEIPGISLSAALPPVAANPVPPAVKETPPPAAEKKPIADADKTVLFERPQVAALRAAAADPPPIAPAALEIGLVVTPEPAEPQVEAVLPPLTVAPAAAETPAAAVTKPVEQSPEELVQGLNLNLPGDPAEAPAAKDSAASKPADEDDILSPKGQGPVWPV